MVDDGGKKTEFCLSKIYFYMDNLFSTLQFAIHYWPFFDHSDKTRTVYEDFMPYCTKSAKLDFIKKIMK